MKFVLLTALVLLAGCTEPLGTMAARGCAPDGKEVIINAGISRHSNGRYEIVDDDTIVVPTGRTCQKNA